MTDSSTVSIQLWVAGRDTDQALARRLAAQEWMSRRLPVDHVGSGSGRFFYDLWREQTGVDPFASEGDFVADSEFHLEIGAVPPTDFTTLPHVLSEDVRSALGFPVAVQVEVIPIDEEDGADSDLS